MALSHSSSCPFHHPYTSQVLLLKHPASEKAKKILKIFQLSTLFFRPRCGDAEKKTMKNPPLFLAPKQRLTQKGTYVWVCVTTLIFSSKTKVECAFFGQKRRLL